MNSLSTYIKEYNNNKSLIHSYLQNNKIENYMHNPQPDVPQPPTDPQADADTKKILGLEIGVFLFLFVVIIALWVWAIVVLVKNWKQLPPWAKTLGVIGLVPGLPGGPIMTLIVVYIGKQS